MRFTVPQFVEKETKILGPLTFKQTIFVGATGGLCIFLYFTIDSVLLFVTLTIILMGAASAMAFVKINHTPLPVYIKNIFIYVFSSRIYLWRKKSIHTKTIIKPEKKETAPQQKKAEIKIGKESQLRSISSRLKIE